MATDNGRVPDGTGLSQAEPQSSQGLGPSREVAELMARAMFDCYRGYNAETQEMLWQRARYGLILQAERGLAVVSKWLIDRALRYDREANAAADGRRKMQGAALACAANELSGFMRLARDSAGRNGIAQPSRGES